MSKKIRVTPELIKKAKAVFESVGKRAIIANAGLTRGELRALERKKLVRKMSTYGKARFVGSTGSLVYVWEWIGD